MFSIKHTVARIAFFAATGFFALAASATQVLVDTGTATTFLGHYSSQLRGFTVYDDFTLSAAGTINHVVFDEGLTSGLFNGSFNFSVYQYAGAQSVGALISTTTLNPGSYTATHINSSGAPIYSVDFSMADLALNAGTYYLSFYGLGNMDFRAVRNGNTGNFLQYHGSSYYQSGAGGLGLRLENVETNAVPEPSSLALFGLGIAGLLVAQRRKG